MTIDVLPEEVFLEVFDFYMHQALCDSFEGIEAWHTLVHVCRQWRNIVFGSPLRLNLQLLCTAGTPVRERLDVWPALPIRVRDEGATSDLDNIIAALEHNDRICEIVLYEAPNSLLERVSAALMQEPFPALTQLDLVAHYATTPAAPPEPFRGGSAPRLRKFFLENIPIPDLPKLLLSATHLVDLYFNLWDIPHPGYVSPEAAVTCISTLTSLENLHIDFRLPQSAPDLETQRTRTRTPTRSVLLSLTTFGFSGFSEYLEDFVARIDAPRLNHLNISILKQIVFDTSHLSDFINRTPRLKAPDEAHVTFYELTVFVTLSSPTRGSEEPNVNISCAESKWRVSSLPQVCISFSPSLYAVENLYIYQHQYSEPKWRDEEIEDTEWLDLFRPFTIVKNLYICELFAPRIVPTLQVLIEEGITEVLPVLQNIFLEGFQLSEPAEDDTGQFVAAQQLSSHTVTVYGWVRT